jgi:hypothetical protein
MRYRVLGVRLPTALKRGMEQLTGLDLSQVKVHYQSALPELVHAHGYAQGDQIYLAKGQEKHLAHELGHVVQQKWGMVQATSQVNGIPINDDPKLELHATQLGDMALAQESDFVNPLSKGRALANKKYLMQVTDNQSKEKHETLLFE